MALKYAANGMQFFDCETCGNEWSRMATKGQPPKACPSCRGKRTEKVKVEIEVEAETNELPKARKGEHEMFPLLQAYAAARVPVMLVGPAGSGKTTACQVLAERMGLEYLTQSCSPDMTAIDFSGYMNASGAYTSAPLYHAFKDGGVFLLDEMDAGSPSALVYANAILASVAGTRITFPNGETVERHSDFVPVASANTFGNGATKEYSGRVKLDGATTNRFGRIEWDYDERFELALAGKSPAAVDWCKYVQRVRRAAKAAKADMLATPRNTINGARLLESGVPRDMVEQTQLWAGVSDDTKRSVIAHL